MICAYDHCTSPYGLCELYFYAFIIMSPAIQKSELLVQVISQSVNLLDSQFTLFACRFTFFEFTCQLLALHQVTLGCFTALQLDAQLVLNLCGNLSQLGKDIRTR